MNIRGTDPTALASVTDLILPLASARSDSGKEFERALQPAPAPPSPASSQRTERPQEANESRQSTSPSSASSEDEDREPVTDETADTQAPPARTKSPRSENAATEPPSDEASDSSDPVPADEEDRKLEAVVGESLAQALAAAQQLPREQRVKDLPPDNPGHELPVEVTKPAVEPQAVSNAPGETSLPPQIDQPVVIQPSPVVEAMEVVAAEAETAGPIAADVKELQPAASGAETLFTPPDRQAQDHSSPSSAASQNAAHTVTPPAQQHNAGVPTTANSFRKQPQSTGSSPTAEVSTPATPVAPADNSSSEDHESADDSPGTRRPIAGMDVDTATTAPNPPIEAPAASPPNNNLPAAETPPPAVPTDAGAQPAGTPNQAGAGTQVNPAVNPATAIIQRLPAHALVRHAAEPQPDGMSVQIDSARFLQRVARAFESARERGGEIRLRLSPPELGALRVEVTMQDQGLVARLEVETPEARAALIENLPALRERLAEQNLRLERFDVELSQRESSQRGNEFPEQQPERQSHPQSRQPRSTTNRQPVPPTITTQVATPAGMQDRRLNVIV